MSMQKPSWRDRVLDRHGATSTDETSDSNSPLDDLGWERVERSQWLEFAQTFDLKASLPEELLVRLVGETASSPALRLEWEGLLKPLQDAVGTTSEDDASLELSGFSKGSSVLHFRAIRRNSVERLAGDDGPPLRETPLAAPVRQFIDVVDAVEHEQDVRMWSSSAMLGSIERLSEELNRLHLVADFRFYSRGGDVRRAQLTERGMGYIKSLAEPRETEETIAIRGRVTELKESGHAKVKAGPHKNATAYDVHMEPGELTAMRLVLGDNVHWSVIAVSNQDQLGRLKSVRYDFTRDLGLIEQADLAPRPDFWDGPASP